MKTIFSTFLLLASGLSYGQSATGIVFEDQNKNGIRDAGEPAVEGVGVTNEMDIVYTDAEGRWELPVVPYVVFSVIKPKDYQVPKDDLNLPLFYYIHRPEGSPDYQYKGVKATGPLPDSIDFPLYKEADPTSFRTVLIADPQPRDARELDYVRRDTVAELTGTNAEYIMILGDIMFDDLSMFQSWKESIGRVGPRTYHVIGNHDINYDSSDDAGSSETYIRHFGPENYVFNVGDSTFIAMDNIIWRGNGYGDGFSTEQLEWLGKVLDNTPKDNLVVLGTHAPLVNPYDRKTGNLKILAELLSDFDNVLAVNGHTHYTYHYEFGEEEGYKGDGKFRQHNIATVSGAWWSGPTDLRNIPDATQRDGTPNGYVFLDIDGKNYTTVYKAAGMDSNQQMRIYLPGNHFAGGDKILVNVYDGMPSGKVEFRIDDGEFQPMTFAPQKDPIAQQNYEGPNKAGNTWIGAVVSHHIWEAKVDMKRNEVYRVDVRYNDDLGRTIEQGTIVLHR